MGELGIILAISVVYLLGIIGAVLTLDEVASNHPDYHVEGFAAIPFVLGIVYWPAAMPVAGLAWLIWQVWTRWKDS